MTRGYIIPIGGAEEKISNRAILKKFLQLSGGEEARIVIIPTASQLPETGPRYVSIFTELGAGQCISLPFEERSDCENKEWLKILENATGVFMTGGNQLRLSTTIGGTPVAEMLRDRNNNHGLHVAGTSAGASIMSEHMIAYGAEGIVPRCDMVSLAPGFGLTKECIVDQHFQQRNRLGRLLAALAFNPRPIGIGLDEDTAAFIAPNDCLEVVGSGAITIIDPSGMEYSSMDSARPSEPVTVIGIGLHILADGCSFDIPNRKATQPSTSVTS